MELKIVSFNIRNGDDKDGHSIAERAPRLQTVIAPFEPDLIGLQEYTPGWEPYIPACFGDNYSFYNQYRNNTVDIEAAPILWRKDKFHCLKTGHFWLSDTPEEESKGWCSRGYYRICTYAVLEEKATGKRFTFMNTHFGFGDQGQTDSAKLIYEYSKGISPYPTFVTGDFNMVSDTAGYRKMTEYFTDANMVTARERRTTFHGYQPEAFANLHIDYCFVDEQVRPTDYKIIDTTIDGKYPSDHYGLYLSLEI